MEPTNTPGTPPLPIPRSYSCEWCSDEACPLSAPRGTTRLCYENCQVLADITDLIQTGAMEPGGCRLTKVDSCQSRDPGAQCYSLGCRECQEVGGRCCWSSSKAACLPKGQCGGARDRGGGACPGYCAQHSDCASCLASESCLWSQQRGLCLSEVASELFCLGGSCGALLSSPGQCPAPCPSFRTCRECMSHRTECGWCGLQATWVSGLGTCSEGGPAGPYALASCNEANYTRALLDFYAKSGGGLLGGDSARPSALLPRLEGSRWHFHKCPREDECANDNHDCDLRKETCVDTEESFECRCREGYQRVGTECRPVCLRGCVHGDCVAPGVCRCHFSFVGPTCATACRCHGHSDCAGEDRLDECTDCRDGINDGGEAAVESLYTDR